jgi:thiol-disulfide isomerase/thioredoxin
MTSKKPLGLPPVLLILGALVAGGLAGVAAVYVMGMGSGNGTVATASAPECKVSPALKAAVASAAKGEVAAMSPMSEPRRLDLSFQGADGRNLTLADFAGKTVLLNLWATWCYPCREEMPALDRLQDQEGSDKFEVLAVNIDTGSEEKPRQFLKEAGIQHLAAYRDSSMGVFNAMKKEGLALGLPVTLLIDAKGCVLGSMNGPAHWDSADAKALVRAAMQPL